MAGISFASIDRIVDELFENYLSRPNVRQPILTQYCDGKQVQCRNRGWMTQWGSKALGDQGYSAIEILRTFYGNDMYINVAEAISGIPASWPGYDLDIIGASGNKVRQIQEQLKHNRRKLILLSLLLPQMEFADLRPKIPSGFSGETFSVWTRTGS